MKTKEQFEKIIAEAEAGIAELDKVKGPWVPEDGGRYWVVDCDSEVYSSPWDGEETDLGRLTLDNIYPTQEAAEQARDRQLATVKVVRRIAELNAEAGVVVDWGLGAQSKCHPYFDHYLSTVTAMPVCLLQECPAEWYGSKETIETVISELPDEIRLMLGVE